MVELITGHAGTNHIDSEDIRALYRGIFGKGNYILEGSENENITAAMRARVPALELILNGNHIRTDGTDEVTFLSTTQGATRTDYICARYKNTGGIESAEIAVVADGNLSNTFDLVDYPMYKCVISGSNMQSITCVLKKIMTIESAATAATAVKKVTEGGTGATTATQARTNLGVNSIYKVQNVNSGTFPLKASDSSATSLEVNIPTVTGYKAVAIAGYNLRDASPSTAFDNVTISKLYISGNKANVRIKNNANKEGTGSITLYILYIKEL